MLFRSFLELRIAALADVTVGAGSPRAGASVLSLALIDKPATFLELRIVALADVAVGAGSLRTGASGCVALSLSVSVVIDDVAIPVIATRNWACKSSTSIFWRARAALATCRFEASEYSSECAGRSGWREAASLSCTCDRIDDVDCGCLAERASLCCFSISFV